MRFRSFLLKVIVRAVLIAVVAYSFDRFVTGMA